MAIADLHDSVLRDMSREAPGQVGRSDSDCKEMQRKKAQNCCTAGAMTLAEMEAQMFHSCAVLDNSAGIPLEVAQK